MPTPASYLGVFATFARNSLVRNMMFRTNFIIECVSSVTWTMMNLGFYLLIFRYTEFIGSIQKTDTVVTEIRWGQWEFFAFLATTMIVNSIVQTFFMPNCENISELIRTGGLDFALLKPIDTQFLISLEKVDWSSLANFLAGLVLLTVSVGHMSARPEHPLAITPLIIGLYAFYVACGVAILYSLMISLSATSIWLGQNRSLYDFWFYITNFSRYPMEIYEGRWGTPLRMACTFIVPVLIVVNVPARIIARPLGLPDEEIWWLARVALVATVASLAISRWIFQRSLRSYRSASS